MGLPARPRPGVLTAPDGRGRPVVVVAVDAEADAVRAGAPAADVLVAGVGPVAAGVATAAALAARARPVVVLGIAGSFDPADRVLVGSRAVAAGLGAEDGDPERLIPLGDLGFGARDAVEADPDLLAAARAALPHARVGELLTVWTVTGSARTADLLRQRHPGAVGEAMEGFGAGSAAAAAGVAFLEVRTASNLVGPRGPWDVRGALALLTETSAALAGAGLLG